MLEFPSPELSILKIRFPVIYKEVMDRASYAFPPDAKSGYSK